MRGIIHDQVSHKFIEGPMQFMPMNNSFQQGTAEKAPSHSDQTQETIFQGNADDIIIPYYEINERYD